MSAAVAFALRCGADGSILEVLGGPSQPPPGISVGLRLQELVPSGARAPIRIMLGALQARPMVLCRPFEFGLPGELVSGFLSGGRHGDSFLLAFAGSAEESARVYEDLMAGLAEPATPGTPSVADRPRDLSEVVEALEEGMVIQTPSGAVLACNERARALLGLSTGEVERWQCADPTWRLESEDGASLSGEGHPAREALRSGESVPARLARVTRTDGSVGWVAIGARPLVHPGEAEPYAVACAVRDMGEAVALRERLRAEGMWDESTGLHSQAFLLVRIEAEMSAFTRHGHPVSLGLCTVDDYAAIAAQGEEAMNSVLREVGQRLKQTTRGSDVIAHVGGGEFSVLLPHTVAVDAGRCAERLREMVSSAPIALPDGRALEVTVSFGVAGAAPGMDAEKLVAAADTALGEARVLGANRVFVALSQA